METTTTPISLNKLDEKIEIPKYTFGTTTPLPTMPKEPFPTLQTIKTQPSFSLGSTQITNNSIENPVKIQEKQEEHITSFYSELNGLNVSLQNIISKEIKEDSVSDLSWVFNQYIKHRNEILEKKQKTINSIKNVNYL